MEIRKERGFPQWLEKSRAKDARLFHSSHRPDGVDQLRLTSRVVGPNQTIERGQAETKQSGNIADTLSSSGSSFT
jgi:hypothetical protein